MPTSPPRSLFEPVRLGPVVLRNRTIRAAAFEGMAPGHQVSAALVDYHRAVARGGVGMTTVAYAAVMQSGLAFPHQLWLRRAAIPGLCRLADAVHAEGARISVQIGHCGNMARPALAGGRALAPSARFNPYGPTLPRAMTRRDIAEVVAAFGTAVRIAKESGFDAIEVHAGHGYLLSQFLSPSTNRRRDEYGGPLANRVRFVREVMTVVREAAGAELAVLVKMNMRDGFRGGLELDEALEVARVLEACGADALVLSGGFVSRTPMYIMRGRMPTEVMGRGIPQWWLRGLVRVVGPWLMRALPYEDHYFLEDARVVRRALSLPLVYVGGVASRAAAEAVLAAGFDAIAMARALIREPDFVARLARETTEARSSPARCDHCNACAARIYTTSMACHHREASAAPSRGASA